MKKFSGFGHIYHKYSKHWPYTVAHTIDCCVCSKMLNHGLNHALFLSLLKFLWWRYILNWIDSWHFFRLYSWLESGKTTLEDFMLNAMPLKSPD